MLAVIAFMAVAFAASPQDDYEAGVAHARQGHHAQAADAFVS